MGERCAPATPSGDREGGQLRRGPGVDPGHAGIPRSGGLDGGGFHASAAATASTAKAERGGNHFGRPGDRGKKLLFPRSR